MQKEKIAIIGSGISGLSSALFLSKKYEVHLFEKNNLLGGHTRTVSLNINNCDYNIDTGFIVFNKKNYPDLVNFFNYLNVKTHNSNMSFAISFKTVSKSIRDFSFISIQTSISTNLSDSSVIDIALILSAILGWIWLPDRYNAKAYIGNWKEDLILAWDFCVLEVL